jgi:uncharacterized protein
MFEPNVVEKIEHPGTMIIDQYLETRMKQLILQVTQQCNLRCGYCAYSGIYDKNRTHSNKRMAFDTAQKAIDFFLERNTELSDVVISFYGGEPLLEFELIKQCVEYAKSQVEGKRIRFSMTTNGTLLTNRVIEFLVKNEFSLAISLDGSKQEHDANRKLANGGGSFDVIIGNIERIQKHYPEYYGEVRIMTTVNPRMNLECALEFFGANDIFSDRQLIFNSMNETNLSQELSYDDNYFKVRNFEHIKLLFSLVGRLDKKYVSPLAVSARGKLERNRKHLRERMEMGHTMHHNGPCMAGVQRLFVRVDGVLFPCERVNEMLDYFTIGSLGSGLDTDKIKSMINIGKLTEIECENCWGLRRCSICVGQIDFDIDISRDAKLKECIKSRNRVLSDLYELCVLNEFGFNVEDVSVG